MKTSYKLHSIAGTALLLFGSSLPAFASDQPAATPADIIGTSVPANTNPVPAAQTPKSVSVSVGFTTPGGSGVSEPPKIKVGEQSINVEEIRVALESLDSTRQAQFARDPQLLDQAVKLILLQRLVAAEAHAKHWEDQPEARSRAKQAVQTAVVDSFLQRVSTPPDSYPSDSDLKAAYEKLKDRLVTPKKYLFAQVFVALPAGIALDDVKKAETRAQNISQELKQGANFEFTAQKQSDEKASAEHKGEMGWFQEDQVPAEILQATVKLKPGEISDPIRLDDGWHILKVVDVKESYTPTFDESRAQLTQYLRTQRTAELRQAYLAELVKKNPIEVNPQALAALLQPRK